VAPGSREARGSGRIRSDLSLDDLDLVGVGRDLGKPSARALLRIG